MKLVLKSVPVLFGCCFLAGLPLPSALAQGSFQNLDFELPPTNLGNSGGPFTYYSIPGWTAVMGPYQAGVTLNTYVLDATTVSLNTTAPIAGGTSVFLTASSYGYPQSTASVSQTGTIPNDAQALHFLVSNVSSFVVPATLPGQFFVTVGGTPVPLQVAGVNGAITDLAANISAWAGQSASLTIGLSVPSSSGSENYFQGLVDNVSFSPVPVPEPGIATLFLLGLLPFCRRK